MRRIDRREILAVVLAVLATSGSSPADDPAKLALFDGKSLDGWKDAGFHNAPPARVEGGSLVLPLGKPMSGVTTTRTDLPTTNYELTYEATRLEGRDFFASATFPVGKSFVTLVNGGWGGTVTGLSSLNGSDASENPTSTSVTYKNNTWYRFRVRVTDATIRAWVDDKEIIVLDHRDLQLGTRIETRPNQPLGFATWKSAGALRTVEVRRLTPAEVAETDKIDKGD